MFKLLEELKNKEIAIAFCYDKNPCYEIDNTNPLSFDIGILIDYDEKFIKIKKLNTDVCYLYLIDSIQKIGLSTN